MMRMFYDTHVHFDHITPEPDFAAVLERAERAGVTRMLAVGGAPEGNRRAVALARAYPARLRAAVGHNRDMAGQEHPLDELETLADDPCVAAIGETGLDYHRGLGVVPAQQTLFRSMLALARRRRLPVIVHSREAEADTLQLLKEHAAEWKGPADRLGVLHCFTGGAEFARALLDLGWRISFSGIVTFRNADALRAVARLVPEDRLLIETDTPYLTPEPFRGKGNEPAFVRRVAEVLAGVRQTTVEALAAATTSNAKALFGAE